MKITTPCPALPPGTKVYCIASIRYNAYQAPRCGIVRATSLSGVDVEVDFGDSNHWMPRDTLYCSRRRAVVAGKALQRFMLARIDDNLEFEARAHNHERNAHRRQDRATKGLPKVQHKPFVICDSVEKGCGLKCRHRLRHSRHASGHDCTRPLMCCTFQKECRCVEVP